MSDKLTLSDAHGGDDRLQAISDATELADAEKYIHQLEANIAALEKKLAQKAAPAKAPSAKGSAKIGARKDASFTAIGTAPSINKTPVGATMVPLPYPTVQDCSNTVAAARSVRFNGCAVYLLDASTQPSGKGDESGTGKGVRSGTVTGEVKPVTGSSSVRVEGKQVVREGDACTMNGGNNPGVFVTTLISSAAPPATAIESSNPYKKQSDAQLAADIAAINAAPFNDAGPLASLKPSTLQQAVTAAIQRDALSGNGAGSAPPVTPLQQRQLAILQSSLGMHNLISGSGDARSPAQQFADENGMLYDSSMGGAAYGATRLVGGSDSTGRLFELVGGGVDFAGGIVTGAGLAGSYANDSVQSLKYETVQVFKYKKQINGSVRILGKATPSKNILPIKRARAAEIEKLSTFKTLGMSNDDIDSYLTSKDGVKYMDDVRAADPTADAKTIFDRAREQLASAKQAPNLILSNLPLIKIVPEGQSVSNYSPFFTTEGELKNAQASGRDLADYFGLPIKSESSSYDIYQITPKIPSNVFVSEIAPTEELDGLVNHMAGGMQYVVPNRKNWSSAELIGKIKNPGK